VADLVLKNDDEARKVAAMVKAGQLNGPAAERAMAALRTYADGPGQKYQEARVAEVQARQAAQGSAFRAGAKGLADVPRRLSEAFIEQPLAGAKEVLGIDPTAVATQRDAMLLRRAEATGGDPRAEQAADVGEFGALMLPGAALLRAGGVLGAAKEASTMAGAALRAMRSGALAGGLAQPADETAGSAADLAGTRLMGAGLGAGLAGTIGVTAAVVPSARNFFVRRLEQAQKNEETMLRLRNAEGFMGGADNPYPFTMGMKTGNWLLRHTEYQVSATRAHNYTNRMFRQFALKTDELAASMRAAGRSGEVSAYGTALNVNKAWKAYDKQYVAAARAEYGNQTAKVMHLAQADPGRFPVGFSNLQQVNARWAQETGEVWWRKLNPGANSMSPEFKMLDDYLASVNTRNAALNNPQGAQTGRIGTVEEGLSIEELIRIRKALSMNDQKYYAAAKSGDPSAETLNAHRANREMIGAIDADIDAFLAANKGSDRPAVAALLEYRDANRNFAQAMQVRDDVSQTAVAQMFGFRIDKDPEAALRAIMSAEPAQQRFMVNAVKETSPEVLTDLRVWAVEDAVRSMSRLDGTAMSGVADPEAFVSAMLNRHRQIIGSEVFTPTQRAEIGRALDTVAIMTNGAIGRSGPGVAPQIEGGIMALASMSQAFIARQAVRILGFGKIEDVFFSREGLKALETLRNTYTKPTQATATALAKLAAISGVPEQEDL